MNNPRWRKSSRSNTGASCVEVRHDLAGLRDSKCPDGPILTVPVAGLVATVRTDKLNR